MGVHIAVQVEETLCRLEFATQAQFLGVLGESAQGHRLDYTSTTEYSKGTVESPG